MGYVTPEQIAQAKEWDLLTYPTRPCGRKHLLHP